MMKYGKEYSFGDVILCEVQYTDTLEIKIRPALVLFEEYVNIICAVITSNPKMKVIKITKKEDVVVESIIKLNYIFTISERMIKRVLFSLSRAKRDLVKEEFLKRMDS